MRAYKITERAREIFRLDRHNFVIFWIVTSLPLCLPLVIMLIIPVIPSLRVFGLLYLLWMYYDRKTCDTGTESDFTGFNEVFPGLTPYVMASSSLFHIPFMRDFVLALGLRSVSKRAISNILNGPPGNVSAVLVGGPTEVLRLSPGVNWIVLKNRKGFIKIALETGSTLVPVFSFGESDTVVPLPEGFVKWYENVRLPQKFKRPIGLIIFLLLRGHGYFLHRKPITTVVGKPIKLPKIENPSDKLVDEYHLLFTDRLIELFEENKVKYDSKGKEATLIIE